MRKKLCLAIAFVLAVSSLTVLFSTGTVEGHSPSISLDYDSENEELTVEVSHSVSDTQSHYIENVLIEVNGNTEIDEDYTEQPDTSSFEFTYDLVVEENSTISVTASCNQAGSDSATLQVGQEDDSFPGFTSILLLLSIIVTTAIYRKTVRPLD